MEERNDLYLVYVTKSISNLDGSSEYDFYFSKNPDEVWGMDWDIENPSSCEDLRPDPYTCSKVVRVKFPFALRTIEDITCYSMEYAVYQVIALAWTDLDVLDEYPEDGRCVFKFGDTIDEVKDNCEKHSVEFNFE